MGAGLTQTSGIRADLHLGWHAKSKLGSDPRRDVACHPMPRINPTLGSYTEPRNWVRPERVRSARSVTLESTRVAGSVRTRHLGLDPDAKHTINRPQLGIPARRHPTNPNTGVEPELSSVKHP